MKVLPLSATIIEKMLAGQEAIRAVTRRQARGLAKNGQPSIRVRRQTRAVEKAYRVTRKRSQRWNRLHS